ncbi:hypothetical protein BKA61DRAFT_696736 [Leptodontidium sp. MPI-SDFR-AT-0119]|nr:hypothetical protein BKA61DRAFT_696736 [Leptodontidium sp. MPI-SDFR-AT-0119]
MAVLQTYTGSWINYSRGPIFGATITFSTHTTDILQGCLALFINYVGSQFWTIISFAMHRLRESRQRTAADGFHQERQAILKTSAAPGATAWDLFVLAFNHLKEKKYDKQTFGAVVLAFVAVLIYGCSLAAGITIPPAIKAASSESLILGGNCGFSNLTSIQMSPSLSNLKQKQDTITAATYARNCYGVDPKPPQCKRFTRPEITWTSKSNVPCPFDSTLCKVNQSTGYSMDTGYIDSLDLGINGAPQDRLLFRKATICAPLMANELAKLVNETDEFGHQHTYVQLYFGPINGILNYTYQYDLATGGAGSGSYLSYAQFDTQMWSPIPALNRTDADVSLVILAQNSVAYIEPVDDPFFAAHVDFNGLFQSRNATYYFADTYFHILACAEQYQYCNPNSHDTDGQPHCTELSSSVAIQRQKSTLNLSQFALLTAGLFDTLLPLANIFGSIGGSGAAALRASDIIFHQVSGPLPDNQWIIEVSAWFETVLARIQHGVVEFATGPPDAFASDAVLMNRETENWGRLCSSIKFGNADDQQSFSALGVGLTFALGCTVILVSWCLDWISGYLEWIVKRLRKVLKKVMDGGEQRDREAAMELMPPCGETVPEAAAEEANEGEEPGVIPTQECPRDNTEPENQEANGAGTTERASELV